MSTVPLNVVAGYFGGALLAWSARAILSQARDPVRTRAFQATALFAALVLAPLGVASYLLAPDWALMYLANPAHVSALLVVPLIIASHVGAMLAGFWISHRLCVTKRTLAAQLNLAGAALVGLVGLALGASRIVAVAHYEAFHYGGETIPLAQSSLVVALGLAIPAAIGAYIYIALTVPGRSSSKGAELRTSKSAKTATEVGAKAVDPAGR